MSTEIDQRLSVVLAGLEVVTYDTPPAGYKVFNYTHSGSDLVTVRSKGNEDILNRLIGVNVETALVRHSPAFKVEMSGSVLDMVPVVTYTYTFSAYIKEKSAEMTASQMIVMLEQLPPDTVIKNNLTITELLGVDQPTVSEL